MLLRSAAEGLITTGAAYANGGALFHVLSAEGLTFTGIIHAYGSQGRARVRTDRD